jgi:hypothetical protein
VTDPHTLLPDWFGFPFRVFLERWRWRLAELDGDICLVADGRLHEPPFQGDPELLDRLVDLANADDQAVERFANRFTGLYSTSSGTPKAEIVDAIRSEALVLGLLRDLARVGLAGARAQARGSKASTLERFDSVRRQAAAALQSSLADLRPLDVGRNGLNLKPGRPSPSPRDMETGEWQILEWVSLTVEETWSLRVPMEDWLAKPIHQRDWSPAQPMPEVRCLTLLGYAYAQLIAQLQARSAMTTSGRPSACRRCGALLPDRSPGGHRRRSDAVWCSNCRKVKNAERQDARRRRLRVEDAASGGSST